MNFYDATTGMYNHRELLKQMKHLDKNIDICLLRMLQSVVIQGSDASDFALRFRQDLSSIWR